MSGRLFITGDTHQYIDIKKLYSNKFKIENDLTKDDILIILGDAGFVFNEDSDKEKVWRYWISTKPYTTICVRGNHDNPIAISKYPIINAYGGKLYHIENSLYYTTDAGIYNFNGKVCLCINGADSIDRDIRQDGVSWWKEEAITQNQVDNAINNVERYNGKIDFLLTHTGGSEVCHSLGFTPMPSDLMLDKVINTVDYSKHYCGHYHKDEYISHSERVVFNDIIEVR